MRLKNRSVSYIGPCTPSKAVGEYGLKFSVKSPLGLGAIVSAEFFALPLLAAVPPPQAESNMTRTTRHDVTITLVLVLTPKVADKGVEDTENLLALELMYEHKYART